MVFQKLRALFSRSKSKSSAKRIRKATVTREVLRKQKKPIVHHTISSLTTTKKTTTKKSPKKPASTAAVTKKVATKQLKVQSSRNKKTAPTVRAKPTSSTAKPKKTTRKTSVARKQ